MKTLIAATAGLAAAMLCATIARADVETVVVTAETRGSVSEAPHIVLTKRADHLITKIRVTCDTRDAAQRKDELKNTIRNLMHAAEASRTISLGVGDDIVRDLTEANLDEIIEADSRPDTSYADVVVKTNLTEADTFEGATTRLKDFIGKTTLVGRSEVARQGGWNLTLVNPEQYHAVLETEIIADAKRSADAFGPNYGVSIDGLERRVDWYQKDSLDMGLYIPYSLHVAPVSPH